MKNFAIVGIIPARGGSKGIPRKNIIHLNKKPLISYSITEAKKSKMLTDVVVSTEDLEIEAISKKYHVHVIKRPKKLASDTSQTIDTIIHVIQNLEKEKKSQIDYVVILQPTSPLRTATDIDKAISKFLKTKCDSLISVNESKQSPYFMYKIKKNKMNPILKSNIRSKRRQDMPKIYQVNGSIYIASRDMILEQKTVFGKNIVPFVMDPNNSIDIDSKLDLVLAEYLLKTKKI